MPKSRKSQKEKKGKKKTSKLSSGDDDLLVLNDIDIDTEKKIDIPDNIDINFDTEQDDLSKGSDDFIDTSKEPENKLNSELEAELNRLKEEYQRQKQITQEMVREREKQQSEIPSMGFSDTEIINPQGNSENRIDTLSNPIVDISMEQQFHSDFELDRKFANNIDSIKAEIVNLQELLNQKLDKEILDEFQEERNMVEELINKVNQFNHEMQRMGKVLNKTDQKLDAVLLDIGFEESLNINKVPNYILVLVYETILNDIINRIKHVIGGPDTEIAVNNIIENVRSHTSGGELFKYEHNKIQIPELKQYLDNKVISPRQIHLTFNSILEKLVEYVPDYSPKNFKAMIKIMSQEYSVEKVTQLENQFEVIKTDLDEIKSNINRFMVKYKDSMENLQAYDDQFQTLKDNITKLFEQVDDIPIVIEKKIEGRIDERIAQKLSELNLDGIKSENISDKSDEKSTKPIFSQGVIELDDGPSKDEIVDTEELNDTEHTEEPEEHKEPTEDEESVSDPEEKSNNDPDPN
jgi:hypothetical protein